MKNLDKNIELEKDKVIEERYNEKYHKYEKYVKKVLGITFLAMGLIFSILGIILIACNIIWEAGIIFICIGAFFIILSLVAFLIKSKANYQNVKKYSDKYGLVGIRALNAKIVELEYRIETLENQIANTQKNQN